jgi:hypothetical protein
MLGRSLLASVALAAAFGMAIADACAAGDGPYPAWPGGWVRLRDGKHGNWDPDKPRGLDQEAPLTPEYLARYAMNLADQARGGQGDNEGYKWISRRPTCAISSGRASSGSSTGDAEATPPFLLRLIVSPDQPREAFLLLDTTASVSSGAGRACAGGAR